MNLFALNEYFEYVQKILNMQSCFVILSVNFLYISHIFYFCSHSNFLYILFRKKQNKKSLGKRKVKKRRQIQVEQRILSKE